jgi:hypothetical protein
VISTRIVNDCHTEWLLRNEASLRSTLVRDSACSWRREGQPNTPHLKVTGSESFARLESPDGRDLSLLRRQIVDHFSRDETLDIVFDLGLRADDFDERISNIARDLITYAVQANRLDALIEPCRQRRPQVGLSWMTILRKRENYRQALDNFDPVNVAQYDEAKIQELLQNPGIIRNHQQGFEETGLQLRRPDHRLCFHAGGRDGE